MDLEWGEEQVQELILTLTTMVAAINSHQETLNVLIACIEQLDARTEVVQSAYHSVSTRLDKLEAQCRSGE